MTSKNSFFKLCLENSKRRLWNIALMILMLFFSLPVFAAIRIGRWMERLDEKLNTFTAIIIAFQKEITGPQNYLLMVVVVVAAILTGIGGFQYLFSKQKTDLYHSMPLKRDTLFFISYVNGIVYFVVPYIICTLLALLVGSIYHLITITTLSLALTTCLLNILGYIFIYTVTVLAVLLTGNIILAALADLVFFIFGPCAKMLFYSFCSIFFNTYYSRGVSSNYYSPISRYISLMSDYDYMVKGSPNAFFVHLFVVLVVTVLLFALCIFLYRKRPSEAAGRSLAFEKTKPFIKIAIMFLCTLAGGLFFREIRNVGASSGDIWFVFGMITALLLSHAIIEIIYQFDFKAAAHHLHHLIIVGVMAGIVACIFRFDLIGYDSYRPGNDEVDFVAIGSYDVQGNINYYDFNQESTNYYGDFYLDSNTYRLEHMKLTDISSALALADDGIAYTKENYGKTTENGDSSQVSSLTFRYHLKNGRDIYRSYLVYMPDCLDAYNAIYTNEEYKKGIFTILTMEDSDIKNFCYASPLGTTKLENTMSDTEVKELIQIYQKELLSQTAYDLQTSYPVGMLYSDFTIYSDSMARSGVYEINEGYVYDSFTETLAYLNAHGVEPEAYKNADNVSYISVTAYSYNDTDGSYDYSNEEQHDYTSKEDIEAILSNTTPSDYSYIDSTLHQTKENMDVIVTYRDVPKNFSSTSTLYFKTSELPAPIQKDFAN